MDDSADSGKLRRTHRRTHVNRSVLIGILIGVLIDGHGHS